MKSYIFTLSILFTAFFAMSAADEPTGNAGDNLDLNAVMELFKDSKSIEEFEQELNSEKNGINNLDLNDDGFVDYIRVIDYSNGNVHAITLQVPYSETESQDVAVIEIEKTGDEEAIAQIIGNEDLYGSNYIIEPQSNNRDVNVNVNVFAWSPVRHIYNPRYVVWVSPWRYRHHPIWFTPWRPLIWTTYHHRHVHHHARYRRVTVYRCHTAHGHYSHHKSHSPTYKAHYEKSHPVAKSKSPGQQKTVHTVQKKETQPANKTQQSKSPAQKTQTQSKQNQRPQTSTRPTSARPATRPTSTRPSSTRPTQKKTATPQTKSRTNSPSKSRGQSGKSNRSSKSGGKR